MTNPEEIRIKAHNILNDLLILQRAFLELTDPEEKNKNTNQQELLMEQLDLELSKTDGGKE